MAFTSIQRIFVRAPFTLHASSKRYITGKVLQATLGPRPKKPAPFPYKEKDYTLLRSLFDKTSSRFDENTKLIILEGPVGIGKQKTYNLFSFTYILYNALSVTTQNNIIHFSLAAVIIIQIEFEKCIILMCVRVYKYQ